MSLCGKKVLVILPKYFGYEEKIVSEIIKEGAEVKAVFENIDYYNKLYNIVLKIFSRKRNSILTKYYKKKCNGFSHDVVFVIRGETLTPDFIEFYQAKNKSAKWFLYQWDSIKNNNNAIKIAKFFDSVSTFDKADSEKMNWNYRPLFFLKESQRTEKRKFSLSFIASLHSERANIYFKLKNQNKNDYFLYLYSNMFHFFIQKYFRRASSFNVIKSGDVHFKSLSLEKTNDIMGQSDIIVDYTHPSQTGFTMRTCEAIGHRCKLITNNKMVLASDFFNENNVLLYEGDNITVPDDFILLEYKELPESIYRKYSISSWLKDILCF